MCNGQTDGRTDAQAQTNMPPQLLRSWGHKKEHSVSVFFDLEKAYNTTWKYGIMKDVHDIGLKGRLPLFLQNYLTDREFKVKVGSVRSELHKQEQGVPQGSILSVTLFSLKINNIVKTLNQGVDCSLYVDDFLICYRSICTPLSVTATKFK